MRKLFVLTVSTAALAVAACSAPADEAATTTETPPATDSSAAAKAPATTGVLNANTATAEQLAAAEGVTPELAAAIVAGRPYADVVALNAALLKTVPAGEAATVLKGIFVPVNLNTGSEEAIKLIPGMTPKMVHEFLEYRPYADMTVFDREIGKYVDAAEVARFRNYVTL